MADGSMMLPGLGLPPLGPTLSDCSAEDHVSRARDEFYRAEQHGDAAMAEWSRRWGESLLTAAAEGAAQADLDLGSLDTTKLRSAVEDLDGAIDRIEDALDGDGIESRPRTDTAISTARKAAEEVSKAFETHDTEIDKLCA